MTDPAREQAIRQLFDDFVDAFATLDGKRVVRLFTAPGVALKQNGTLQGFSTIADVERYYQAALDNYRSSGCRRCVYFDLDTQFLNDSTAVASASWELLRGDGSAVRRWRQAYFVSRSGGAWRIFGSAFVSA